MQITHAHVITDGLTVAKNLRQALSSKHVPQRTLGDTEGGVKVVLGQNYRLDRVLDTEIHHSIHPSCHLVFRQNLQQHIQARNNFQVS